MSDGIRHIEISFPEAVELTEQDQKDFVALAARICDRYAAAHLGRVMWPFGIGLKITVNPMMLGDDEPIPFDATTFQVECHERADYACKCARCGKPQGDHKGLIVDPPAGDCEFEPASPAKPRPDLKVIK